MPGSGRAGNASSLPSEPPVPVGRALWSPARLSCCQNTLLTSWPSRALANSRAPQSASPGSGCAGGQAHTRPAGRAPCAYPGGPGPAAPAAPQHRSQQEQTLNFLLASINFQKTTPLPPRLWPWCPLLHRKGPSRAEAPGAASGLRESPPHRSLAGLEAGSSRDSWCAGCRPLPSPHSPLGTRGSWEPGADPSDVENNYGKTAATHAGGAGRPSGRSPWLPARCPHAASRPLAVPTVPAQAHIPPRSWLAGAQPVFYKYLAGPTLWPRVLCTARGLSQPETLVLD